MASGTKATSSKGSRQKTKAPLSPSTEEVLSQPVTEAPVPATDAGSPAAALAEDIPRNVDDAHAAEMTEAPLVVRPFLSKMTKSELHAVITGGFATVAGGMLAAYISFGVSAAHLITASIMSAPAALACAKLVYPETEESMTQIGHIEPPKSEETNALQAASNGAVIGLIMAGNIVANLVGFLALIACLNRTLLWFGSMVAIDNLSFEWLLSKVFTPLAFIMGVPWNDCGMVGELIGIKTFANEFIAYSRLATVINEMEARSVVIATYALCGFSNVGSIGVSLGALGAVAPDRKSDCAAVAVRALFSGSLACFLTACVAGTLIA